MPLLKLKKKIRRYSDAANSVASRPMSFAMECLLLKCRNDGTRERLPRPETSACGTVYGSL